MYKEAGLKSYYHLNRAIFIKKLDKIIHNSCLKNFKAKFTEESVILITVSLNRRSKYIFLTCPTLFVQNF